MSLGLYNRKLNRKYYHNIQIDSTFLLFPKADIWRFFVEPDSEAFQFVLEQFLVLKRLEDVENDEDQTAGASDSNNLTATSFTVFGALDDTWQIQQLDLGALVLNHTRDGGECRELVGSYFGVNTGQVGEESRFTD